LLQAYVLSYRQSPKSEKCALRFDVWLQSVEPAWQIDIAIGREV
jgi:hypothetical protein